MRGLKLASVKTEVKAANGQLNAPHSANLYEGTLSFLGVGVQPPTPSWGNMISEGQGMVQNAPWLILYPSLALMMTVVAFNLVGDGLRDAMFAGSGRA